MVSCTFNPLNFFTHSSRYIAYQHKNRAVLRVHHGCDIWPCLISAGKVWPPVGTPAKQLLFEQHCSRSRHQGARATIPESGKVLQQPDGHSLYHFQRHVLALAPQRRRLWLRKVQRPSVVKGWGNYKRNCENGHKRYSHQSFRTQGRCDVNTKISLIEFYFVEMKSSR